MKFNSYDPLAPYYDFLSLILGKSYRDSKRLFLDGLKEGDQVLYLGGGTGANLPEILDRIGRDGKLCYIEASSQMIAKARRRVKLDQLSQIVFLHQSDFSFIPLDTYDVVLTQLLLEILPEHEITNLLQELGRRTKSDTSWIFLDFLPIAEKKWLIQLMIRFFRCFTGNPRKDLPDYARHFGCYGWQMEEKKSLKRGFIQAWLLKRGVVTNSRQPGI